MPSGTLSSGFTFVAPTTVLGVVSSTGPTTGLKAVTVYGTEFRIGATVTFGGSSATSVVVVNNNVITCLTPAHAIGAVTVVVTNVIDSYGDAGAGLNGTGTMASAFTYVLEAPVVTGIYLDYGITTGGERVVVTGAGFIGPSGVTIGGVAATSVVLLDANQISCVTPAHAAGFVAVTVTNTDAQADTLYNCYEYQAAPLSTDTKGWWSSSEDFAGSVGLVVTPLRPLHARGWDKIVGFATGGAAMLGGSPGPSVMYGNHLIYASDDYTLTSSSPAIYLYDGQADKIMTRIPLTTTAAVPNAIMSMLRVGSTIFFSTYDSGTTDADFAGRVFAYYPISNVMEPVGTGFSGGEVPYALAWHMNRLWVGTNQGDGLAGKIYFFRPGIDSDWTADYDLTTSTLGGATSMVSFQGKLLVGTDNADALRGKVLARSADSTYAVSDTGTGGTAKVNNGYLSMVEFQSNVYASYWNPDTTAISLIRKFNGSAWSTVYTGTTATLRPFISLFVANNKLYAIGGGNNLSAALVRSTDGTTWENLTPYLVGPTTETALPVFGLVYS